MARDDRTPEPRHSDRLIQEPGRNAYADRGTRELELHYEKGGDLVRLMWNR